MEIDREREKKRERERQREREREKEGGREGGREGEGGFVVLYVCVDWCERELYYSSYKCMVFFKHR